MRLRLLSSMAGIRHSYAYGDVAEFGDAEAKRMVAGGLAEPVADNVPTTRPAPPAIEPVNSDPVPAATETEPVVAPEPAEPQTEAVGDKPKRKSKA